MAPTQAVESESESECLDPQMSCEPRARRVCTTPHPAPPHPHPGTHGAQVTTTKLLSTLDALAKYVAGVKAGSATPDAEVVQLLQDAMTAAPRLPAQTFDKIFNSRVQDMLVVVYLANLTRAQLTLAEKLQGISNAA